MDHDQSIRASWEANARAWATSVRDQLIPSRRAGTDAAILDACLRLKPARALDVGCGEGWLSRALAERNVDVVGVDAIPALVESARAAGGAVYEVVEYETLAGDPNLVPGPFDMIVCNYSLFGDPLAPLLSALVERLSKCGRIVIQTVHPWVAAGNGHYNSGWREEAFADFAVEFPAAMPWYFRTLDSWTEELLRAGLYVERFIEPIDPVSHRPLSVILRCATVPVQC